jgi:glyceraldehyde 3-phosphate dehydrogenase
MHRSRAVEVLEPDAAGKLPGHVGCVCHDQECHPLLRAGVSEEIDHLLLMGRVDARGWFVGEDRPGSVGQRPGHGHPLLLAHAQFGRPVVEPVTEAHRLEQPHRPVAVGPTRSEGHRHEHVLEGCEAGEQVELLEDQAELVGPHTVAAGFVETGDVDAVDDHPPRVGPHDPGDHVEQRRLSGAAAALKRAVLVGGEPERADIEDVHLLASRHGERLANVEEFENGCGHGPIVTAEAGRRSKTDVFAGRLSGRAVAVYSLPILSLVAHPQRCGPAIFLVTSRLRRFAVSIRVGINGFGRIGRLTYRAIYEKYGLNGDVQVVALNDLTDAKTNAHLLEFDSNYGPFKGHVGYEGNDLVVDGHKIEVFAEKDPGSIPWGSQDVQIVVESTGFFTDATKAVAHKRDSVKKVVISAPAKNEDLTIVLGVNDSMYDPKKHHVISNASCTTNGLAPVAKVLHETYGIDRGLLTTVHAYTNSQKTVDTAAKDLRDARAAALNIVPSSTGAARAVGLVIPELQGKFTGMAFRVPVATVSVVDFTALLGKEASPADINAAMKKAAEGPLKGILRYTDKELVSTDLKGDPHSSIFSAVDTIGLGNLVKVVSWYDNEWGYSNRVADLLNFLEDKGLD